MHGAAGFDKVRVELVLAVQRGVGDKVPGPTAVVVLRHMLLLDRRAGLCDVDGQRDQQPLSHQGYVVLRLEEGDQNPHGVRGRQKVDQQKVVAVAADAGRAGCVQRHGELLRLREVLCGVGDFPRGPVFEQDGTECRVGPEVCQFVAVRVAVERRVQALVGLHAAENFEDVGGRICRRRVGLEEFGERRVVARRGQSQCFHADFAAVQFIGISQVDQWVAQTCCQTVEDGFGVRRFLGSTGKQKFLDDVLPVVALEHELIFEKVDKGSLVLFLAQVLAVVVLGDFGRRVDPRV